MDTLVFGGNFLHSYNIPTRRFILAYVYHFFTYRGVLIELRVREIELATRVPKKFRFPFFTRYVASRTPTVLHSPLHPIGYVGMSQTRLSVLSALGKISHHVYLRPYVRSVTS